VECLDDETLVDYLHGRLERDRRPEVEAHVDACADCYRLFAELARVSTTFAHAARALGIDESPAPVAPGPPGQLAPGDRVGRYVIRDPLGSGGMGVVYEALDPLLGRRLALKVVRGDGFGATELPARLYREAQALARLTHPNVVAVHDVGRIGDGLFIVMDLVEGTTADGWLAARPRKWHEVLELYLRAGRGLLAAHEAGLVHRDFKPGNVLVGADGRVCVTDFGLVRLDDAPAEAPAAPAELDVAATPLTRTGVVMGSPAYMPPEQVGGRPVDARSDVFSFCVSLWAGLYGQRPFAGETLRELRQAMLSGRVEVPPGREVPAWLERLVASGLAADPERRPQLAALLSELERERSQHTLSHAERLLTEASELSRLGGGDQKVVQVAVALLRDLAADLGDDRAGPVAARAPAPAAVEVGDEDEVGPEAPILAEVEMAGSRAAAIVERLGFQTLASHFLLREGLGSLSPDGRVAFEPDSWYPVRGFVKAAHRFLSELGPRALFNVGVAAPGLAGRSADLAECVARLDIAHHRGFRLRGRSMHDPATGRITPGVGRYRAEPLGERWLAITASGPWPCELDRGFLTRLVLDVAPDAVITHDEEQPCRKRGARRCRFFVRWGASEPPRLAPGSRRLRRAADLDAFLFEPFGRYLVERSCVSWSLDPLLAGAIVFGVPEAADAEKLAAIWTVFQQSTVPHANLLDMRRVTELGAGFYQAFTGFLERERALIASRVSAQAVLRPRGMVGELITGYLALNPIGNPLGLFEEPGPALEFLGRGDGALAAELDALYDEEIAKHG
jgi:hypothetical protein